MDNTTRWWWVRHAPVVDMAGKLYGAQDVDCDVSDEPAFISLAEKLPEGAIWLTSHLSRTHKTAEAIAAAGLKYPPPVVDENLGEQSFGDWQGLSWDEMKTRDEQQYQEFWENPAENAPPGGESFAQLIERTRAAIEKYSILYKGRDIICVAHGGTIRAAIAHALELSATSAMAFQVDNLSITRLDQCDDKLLQGRGGSWKVACINLVR